METELNEMTVPAVAKATQPVEARIVKDVALPIADAVAPAAVKQPAAKKVARAAKTAVAVDPMQGHELTSYPNTVWVWAGEDGQPVGIWHTYKRAYLLPVRVYAALLPLLKEALKSKREIDPRTKGVKVSFRPEAFPWQNVHITRIAPMVGAERENYTLKYGDVTAKVITPMTEYLAPASDKAPKAPKAKTAPATKPVKGTTVRKLPVKPARLPKSVAAVTADPAAS